MSDSSAKSHMLNDRTMFSSLHKYGSRRAITLGDGRTVSATTTCSVFIETRVSEQVQERLVLNGPLHVPILDSNLVFCSSPNRDGYEVKFGDGECTICRDDELICTGVLQDRLHVFPNVMVSGDQTHTITDLYNQLRIKYHVKRLSTPTQYFGWKISHFDNGSVHKRQPKYIQSIPKNTRMTAANSW